MHSITILTIADRIAGFYSLSPFFYNKDSRWNFTFTANATWFKQRQKRHSHYGAPIY